MRFVSRCFGENVAWFCQPARTFWSFVNRDDSDDQPEEEQNRTEVFREHLQSKTASVFSTLHCSEIKKLSPVLIEVSVC